MTSSCHLTLNASSQVNWVTSMMLGSFRHNALSDLPRSSWTNEKNKMANKINYAKISDCIGSKTNCPNFSFSHQIVA